MIVLWLLNVFFVIICAKSVPIRETSLGVLEGYYMKTRSGRLISAFTAIPYAVPPVGELRFMPPVPVQPWEGILNASKVAPICVQRNYYTRQKEIVGQEDCLYLNIYSPFIGNEPIPNEKLLPVMVFFHGGGWMCGDGTTYMYGPEHLLDRDVLLVALNYRLGPLGFLSTQDEHCPGNNGLKDQQEALRFIQRNIHAFGGNSQSVTIFGESSGGASVNYHMLSETSAGLFHKAISESGTALVPWAEAPPGEPKRNAFRLAKFLDCPQTPSERMIKCLRNLDSYDIIGTEFKFYEWDYEPMTTFKAVIEPDLPGAFLRRSPRLPPSTNLVPWLTGINKDEGCVKSVWITAYPERFEEFMSGFETIAPVTFYYENSPLSEKITEILKKEYLNGDEKTIKEGILKTFKASAKQYGRRKVSGSIDNLFLTIHSETNMKISHENLREIYSDSFFGYPALESVEQTLNYSNNPVYLYQLSYRASNSFSQIFGDPKGNYGVCHADDLIYLFPIHFLQNKFSPEDNKILDLIITLWTNFATSGNPTIPVEVPFDWQPATNKDNLEYLDIGVKQVMKQGFAKRAKLWSQLPLWHNLKNQSQRLKDEL